MGLTIADAVAQLPPWRSVLITPADMPAIAEASFRAVAAAASEDMIVAPVYDGLRGHPVAFGREFFAALACLQGDVGARDLLRRYREAVGPLPGSSRMWIAPTISGGLSGIRRPRFRRQGEGAILCALRNTGPRHDHQYRRSPHPEN